MLKIQVKTLSCVIMLAVLSACSGSGGGGKTPSSYAPDDSVGVLKIGNPYEVMGETYTPAYHPEYEEVGVASWYGPGFHGRYTANGDKYDQHSLTAAHRTLPLPSVVEVTNLENGRTAIVTVNDRGPFSKKRIIDLSKAAADKLGIIASGTARVRVKYMREASRQLITSNIKSGKLRADPKTLAMLDIHEDPLMSPSPDFSLVSSAYADEPAMVGSPINSSRAVSSSASVTPVLSQDLKNPAPLSSVPDPAPGVIVQTVTQTTSYEKVSGPFVQAASFSQEQNAQELAQKLASLGTASVKPVSISGRTWYRVRLGPLSSETDARHVLAAVQGMGIPDAQIIRE
jgi:rare lipoprotein A